MNSKLFAGNAAALRLRRCAWLSVMQKCFRNLLALQEKNVSFSLITVKNNAVNARHNDVSNVSIMNELLLYSSYQKSS